MPTRASHFVQLFLVFLSGLIGAGSTLNFYRGFYSSSASGGIFGTASIVVSFLLPVPISFKPFSTAFPDRMSAVDKSSLSFLFLLVGAASAAILLGSSMELGSWGYSFIFSLTTLLLATAAPVGSMAKLRADASSAKRGLVGLAAAVIISAASVPLEVLTLPVTLWFYHSEALEVGPKYRRPLHCCLMATSALVLPLLCYYTLYFLSGIIGADNSVGTTL